MITYHFNNFNLSLKSQLVQEHLQVFLHLNGVVFHLGDGEDAHLAVLPGAVLLQQEWKEHQHAAVVHDPPDVDVAGNLENEMDLCKNICPKAGIEPTMQPSMSHADLRPPRHISRFKTTLSCEII